MACGGNSCYFGFGLFLLILGLVIDVIGVASPYWILADEDGVKVNGGLWQMCTSASDVSECSDFTKVQGIMTYNNNSIIIIMFLFVHLKNC